MRNCALIIICLFLNFAVHGQRAKSAFNAASSSGETTENTNSDKGKPQVKNNDQAKKGNKKKTDDAKRKKIKIKRSGLKFKSRTVRATSKSTDKEGYKALKVFENQMLGLRMTDSFAIWKTYLIEIPERRKRWYYNEFLAGGKIVDQLLAKLNFYPDKHSLKKGMWIKEIASTWVGEDSLTIALPPLKPNKFYEILFLRYPMGDEYDDIVNIFNSIDTARLEANLNTKRLIAELNHKQWPFVNTTKNEDIGKLVRQCAGTDCQANEKVQGKKGRIGNNIGRRIYSRIDKPTIPHWKLLKINSTPIEDLIKEDDIIDKDPNLSNARVFLNFKKDYLEVGDTTRQKIADIIVKEVIEGTVKKYRTLPNSRVGNVLTDTVKPRPVLVRGALLDKGPTTYLFDFDDQVRRRILPFFGFAFYGSPRQSATGLTCFTGFQIDFTRVNKDVNLSLQQLSVWRRFSLLLGVTVRDEATTQNNQSTIYKPLFTNATPIAGLGWRFGNMFRVNAGGVLTRKLYPDFLNKKSNISILPAVGVSLDLDVRRALTETSKTFENIFK